MSSYKTVALVGAGSLGKHFVDAFAANKDLSLVVISRAESAGTKAKELPAGTKVIPADLTSLESITAAFKENKVDVVVSTLGHTGLGSQNLIADGAKAAGVKLFVLSEWGFVTLGATEGPFAPKEACAKHLVSVGLPSVRIFTGVFYGWLGWASGYSTNQKISYTSNPSAKASTTAEQDVAGFTSYIISHLWPAQLENKAFRIQGDFLSPTDLAEIWGTSAEQVTKIPGDETGFVTGLAGLWASGGAVTGDDDNGVWVGHEWKKYQDYVKK